MKYSTFIQKVRNLGYITVDTGLFLSVSTAKEGRLIIIDKSEVCGIDSVYESFNSIPDTHKEQLLSLACELAITPPEEREDEEMYRLRLPFVLESRSYLNLCDDGSYFISGKHDSAGSRTMFSESEIVTLKEKYNLDGFIMEGVLEDE